MLTLDSLDITSFDVNSLTLTWSFKATTESLTSYTVDVYRSESPGVSGLTGFDVVTSGISATTYSYIDSSVSGLYDPLRVWYYRLDVKSSTESLVQPTQASYRKGVSTDKFHKEILRRKKISLDKYTGRDFFILKRRTYGTHCTECWDSTLMRITSQDCDVCYGTGWIGGYFTAIPIKGMMNPAPKYNQITMFGEWMPQDSLLTMLNYPPIKSKDIVVDDKNKRWAARQIRTIEKGGITIEQSVQCSLVALDDDVYTFPVE